MHILIPPTMQPRLNIVNLPGVELSATPSPHAGQWWVYQTYASNGIDWTEWTRNTFSQIGVGEYVGLVPELWQGETKAKLRGRIRSNQRHNPDLWEGLRIDSRGQLFFTQLSAGKLGGAVGIVKLFREGA
jgi:hypothetical protein